MKKIFSFFLAISLLLCISNVSTSASKKVSLSFTSSDPINSAVNVRIDKSINIKFNSVLKQGTAFSKISLVNSKNKQIKYTTKISKNILTVDTEQYMDYSEKYTLKIPPNAIKSQSGDLYKKAIVINFTTDSNKPPLEFNLLNVSEVSNGRGFESAETRIENNIIGTPELKLVANNMSNKNIVAFEFTCSFLDNFNRPVYKVGSKSATFKGIVQKADIPSLKNEPNNWDEFTFNLTLYELATQIKDWGNPYAIRLTLVKYADGTTWRAK